MVTESSGRGHTVCPVGFFELSWRGFCVRIATDDLNLMGLCGREYLCDLNCKHLLWEALDQHGEKCTSVSRVRGWGYCGISRSSKTRVHCLEILHISSLWMGLWEYDTKGPETVPSTVTEANAYSGNTEIGG